MPDTPLLEIFVSGPPSMGRADRCRASLSSKGLVPGDAHLHPTPLRWASLAHNGVAGPPPGTWASHEEPQSVGGTMLTTDVRFDRPVEVTLAQVVTLRRPAWTSSEQQDDTEFHFGVHFWRQRPGWPPRTTLTA